MKGLILVLVIITIILLGFAGVITLAVWANGATVKSDTETFKIPTPVETIKPIETIANKISNELNKNYYRKQYTDKMFEMDKGLNLVGCKKIEGLFGDSWKDTYKCSDESTFIVEKIQDKSHNFVLIKVTL